MIRFTPFDFPFLAAPSQAGDTFAFAFEFRSPQQTSVGGGEYVINHGSFGIDQAGVGFAVTGGFSGLPARGVYPPQDMKERLSCSILNTFGLFFNVAGFNALGSDAESVVTVSHGKFEAAIGGLSQDAGSAVVQFRGGLYISSPDVFFQDNEFIPSMRSNVKSHGMSTHILNSVSSQESGSSIVFTVRGKYEEKEGVDTQANIGCFVSVHGFSLEAVGSVLKENVVGISLSASRGEYRDGGPQGLISSQSGLSSRPGIGRYQESFALLSQDGGFVLAQDGDPIVI